MTLAGMLDKLYARRRFGIRPGVGRVRLLLDRLGQPERTFRTIHVVGTNGKGSTSAFLSSILQASGLRTALFTSPHLISFSERFRIDGLELPEELLAQRLNTVLDHAPSEATFFEIVTALAAFSFAEDRIDIAVMEAGMGGRSDATAALPGMMTLVTPISYDHSEYLGATLEQITEEKGGIIEPETLAVIGCQERSAGEVLREICRTRAIRCCEAGTDFRASLDTDGILDYHGLQRSLMHLKPGIPGRYQAGNAALALAGAEMLGDLGITIPDDALHSGVQGARWPGRMEIMAGTPPLLLDGAHNPAGAAALASALGDLDYRRLLMVFGAMAEKDVAGMLAPLAPLVSTCYCVTPAVERALEGAVLAAAVERAGIPAVAGGGVAAGIRAAQCQASNDDLILICGSLFVVGEAKAWLAGKHFEGIRG